MTARRTAAWRRTARLPLLLLLAGLVACTGDTEPVATEDDSGSGNNESAVPDLEGRTFESTEVRGHTLVEGTTVMLTFEDGRVAASAGCNTMSAAASWDDGTLTVAESELATTMMGCPGDLQTQDDWLAAFLTSAPALALGDGTLMLGDDSTGMTLEERADVPLVGTTWRLDGLVTADAVSSTPTNVEATITIDAAGERMAVSAGCNTGSAPVTVEPTADQSAGTITVGPVAITKKLCADEAMDVEAHVLGVLQGPVDYRIEGQRLTLTTGADGLALGLALVATGPG